MSFSLTSTIYFHIFLAPSSSDIKNSEGDEEDNEGDAKCDTDYLYPGSRADPSKRQATNADGAVDP